MNKLMKTKSLVMVLFVVTLFGLFFSATANRNHVHAEPRTVYCEDCGSNMEVYYEYYEDNTHEIWCINEHYIMDEDCDFDDGECIYCFHQESAGGGNRTCYCEECEQTLEPRYEYLGEEVHEVICGNEFCDCLITTEDCVYYGGICIYCGNEEGGGFDGSCPECGTTCQWVCIDEDEHQYKCPNPSCGEYEGETEPHDEAGDNGNCSLCGYAPCQHSSGTYDEIIGDNDFHKFSCNDCTFVDDYDLHHYNEDHYCEDCGHTCTHNFSDAVCTSCYYECPLTYSGITFEHPVVNNFDSNIIEAGTYYLHNDVTLTGNITIGTNSYESVKLYLNGHVLNLNGYSINCSSEFYLYDDIEDDENNKHYFTIVDNLWTLTNSVTTNYVTGGVITGGNSGNTNGGAITNTNYLEIEGVNFVGNKTGGNNAGGNNGGAIYFAGYEFGIVNCKFIGNIAGQGGAIFANGNGNILDCEFNNNVSTSSGGALFVKNDLYIANSNITNNKAGVSGGAIYQDDCNLTLVNVSITDNNANVNGAGIFNAAAVECLAKGTKIALADGTIKNIEDVKVNDMVLSFDHNTGNLVGSRVYYIYASKNASKVYTLNFTNGIKLTLVDKHDLFEKSSMKYVTIDYSNYNDYVGKYFYNALEGRWEQLLSVTEDVNKCDCYSIYSTETFNAIANCMLTIADDQDHMLNFYEFNNDLTINQAQLQLDIETYGLAPYSYFENKLSLQEYNELNLKYMFIMYGKGLLTKEEALSGLEEVRSSVGMRRLAFDFRSTPPYQLYVDGLSNTLMLGTDVTIRENYVKNSAYDSYDVLENVYLEASSKHVYSKIGVIEDATGINVGVTLEETTGIFGYNIYADNGSSVIVTSDNEDYSVEALLDQEANEYTYFIGHNCNDVIYDRVLTSSFTGGSLDSGNYFLDEDIILSNAITVAKGAEVNICLNGHVLALGTTATKLVDNKGIIRISDCKRNTHDEEYAHTFVVEKDETDPDYMLATWDPTGTATGANVVTVYGGIITSLKTLNGNTLIESMAENYITDSTGVSLTNLIIMGIKNDGNNELLLESLNDDFVTLKNLLIQNNVNNDSELNGFINIYNYGAYNEGIDTEVMIDSVDFMNNVVNSTALTPRGAFFVLEVYGEDLKTLNNVRISHNIANVESFIGFIECKNELRITKSTFKYNTINSKVRTSNEASKDVTGLIYCLGDLEIKKTDIANNTVTSVDYLIYGGLIRAFGILVFDDVYLELNTINAKNNSTRLIGGLILVNTTDDVYISFVQTTIAENRIISDGNVAYGTGAFIYSNATGTMEFDSDTIFDSNIIELSHYVGSDGIVIHANGELVFNAEVSYNEITVHSYPNCYDQYFGIFAYVNGKVTLEDASLFNNDIIYEGNLKGGFFYSSKDDFEVTNVLFSDNTLTPAGSNFIFVQGGLVYSNGDIIIKDSRILTNNIKHNDTYTGALFAAEKGISVEKTVVYGNEIDSVLTIELCNQSKGALFATDASGLTTDGHNITIDSESEIHDNTVSNRTQAYGGFIYTENILTIGCDIYNNTYDSSFHIDGDDRYSNKGLILYSRELNLTGDFYNNKVYSSYVTEGAFIYISGSTPVELSDISFTNNTYSRKFDNKIWRTRGILILSKADLTLNNVEISGNSFSTNNYNYHIYSIGVVYGEASNITINKCKFENNTVSTNQPITGGLIAAYNVTITGDSDNLTVFNNNTIINNNGASAGYSSNGLLIYAQLGLSIGNTKFSNNNITDGFIRGGIIYANSMSLTGKVSFEENTLNLVDCSNDSVGGFVYVETTYGNEFALKFDNNTFNLNNKSINGLIMFFGRSYKISGNQCKTKLTNLYITNNDVNYEAGKQACIKGLLYGEFLVLDNAHITNNDISAYTVESLVYANNALQIKNSFIDDNTISQMSCGYALINLYNAYEPTDTETGTKLNQIVNTSIQRNNVDGQLIGLTSNCPNGICIDGLTLNDNTARLRYYVSNYSYGGLINFGCYGEEIKNSTINGNTVSSIYYTYGGLIHNYKNMTFTNVEINNNNVYVNSIITGGLLHIYELTANGLEMNGNNVVAGYVDGEDIVRRDLPINGGLVYAYNLIDVTNGSFKNNTISNDINGLQSTFGAFDSNGVVRFIGTEMINNKMDCSTCCGLVYLSGYNKTIRFEDFKLIDTRFASTYNGKVAALMLDSMYGNVKIQLAGTVIVDENYYLENNANFCIKFYNDTDETAFVIDENKPLTSNSIISLDLYKDIKNDEKRIIAKDSSDYIDNFKVDNDNYFIRLIDKDIYFSGRITHQPTLASREFVVFFDDLNGVTAEYQWYKAGNEPILIDGQTENIYTSDNYILGSFYCVCTLSDGKEYKSANFTLAPAKIADPTIDNGYIFEVDESGLKEAGATVEYAWYKKLDGSVIVPEALQEGQYELVDIGTDVVFQGDPLGTCSSVYDPEIGAFTNGYNEGTESYEQFAIRLNLEAGQLLIIDSSFLGNYFYLVYGDVLNDDNCAIYDQIMMRTYVYINKTGVYSLYSPYKEALTYYHISTFDYQGDDIKDNVITYAEGHEMLGELIYSFYDAENEEYYAPNTDPICVSVNMQKGQAISLKPYTTADVVPSFMCYYGFEYEGSFVMLSNGSSLTDNSLFIAPFEGVFTFGIVACDSDNNYPIRVKVESVSLGEYDVSGFTTYDNADFKYFYVDSKLDENGYFYTVFDSTAEKYVAATAYIDEHQYIVINFAGIELQEIMVLYSEDQNIVIDQEHICFDTDFNNCLYEVTKPGYYTFLIVAEGEQDGDTLAFKLYTLASENYELVSCDDANLNKEYTGNYYSIATYTQGEDVYSIKSAKVDYISNEIATFNKDAQNYTFNNDNIAFEIKDAVTTGYKVYYRLNGSTAWSYVVPTNAGTYDVKVMRNRDNYYKEVEEVILAGLVIEKASVDEPTVVGSYTYNGNEQTVSLNGVENYMSTSDSLTKVNAGTYNVTYTLDDNHKWANAGDGIVSWTINKADYDMNGVSFNNDSIVYDGNAHSLAISGILPNGITVSYSANNSLTNVGEEEVTATFTGDDNHNAISNMTATLKITKATYDMSGVSFNNASIVYDGNSHSLAISGTLPYGVSVFYSANNALTNVGSVEVTATFQGNDNYNAISNMTATLEITKATYDMSGVSFNNASIVYDGAEHELVVGGTLPEGVTVSYTANKLTNVGEVEVVASFVGNANYNEIESKTATLKITKAQNSVNNLNQNNVFCGDELTPSADSLFGEIIYSFKLASEEEYTLLTDKNYPTVVGVYEMKAEVLGTDNYEGAYITYSFEVSAKEVEKKEDTQADAPFEEQSAELIEGKLPVGVVIIMTEQEDEKNKELKENVKNEVGKKSAIISKFEIHLEDQNGIRVENIDGNKYRITITLPEELRGRTGYAVIYIDDNYNVTKYDMTMADENTIVFETTHFSDWAIVADKEDSFVVPFILIVLGFLLALLVVLFVFWKIEFDKTDADKMNERDLRFFDVIYRPINKLLFDGKKKNA